MVLLYDGHFGETIIFGNTYLIGNIIIKVETCYYPFHALVYILAMKNIGFNQAKHKRSQISHFTKLLKGLSLVKFCRLLIMK